jgi:hypothetical protein
MTTTDQLLDFANLWQKVPESIDFEGHNIGVSLTRVERKHMIYAFDTSTGDTYVTKSGDELIFISYDPAAAVRLMLMTLGII